MQAGSTAENVRRSARIFASLRPGPYCPPGVAATGSVSAPPPLSPAKPREFFIHGVTSAGRPFRPSDWAERLCGVMSCYRPGGIATGRDAYIGYSPYVRPTVVGGVKCVVVDERLRELERMAFDFVMNFARDNDLAVYEGCSLPEPGSG